MNHKGLRTALLAAASSAIMLLCAYAPQVQADQPAGRQVSSEAVGGADAVNESARPAAGAPLQLTFALTSGSQSQAADFVNSLTDPTSPNYHKWISPQQFGAKFGARLTDINTVTGYLKQLGLTNITVWPDRLFVSAQTTRQAAESAFGVSILGYNRSSDSVAKGYSPTYYAPDKQPTVSNSVAQQISAIFGLSNAVQALPAQLTPSATAFATSQGFLQPTDLANVYDTSSLHSKGLEGQGETIAIFSPTAFQQSDIARFEAANNITSAKVNVINVTGSGGTGNTSLDDQVEACIDIETVLGQAPGATINVYEAPNDGGFEIFQQAEKDDPNILSESYGIDENEVNSAYASAYETIRQALAAEGVTIFVASGDSGAFDSATHNIVTTSIDAASAYVTAVGGTELSPLSSAGWNGEVAWTYNDGTTSSDSGSGGGLSKFIGQPSWQTGPGVKNSYSNGMRQVPDVAGLASSPYYDISTEGGWSGWGGTSCAAPLWAGSIALIEQSVNTRLGNIDPKLYSVAAGTNSPFHDITSGNDGLYYCTSGWDFVTGLGSVDFGKLLSSFNGASTAAVTSFTPASGLPGSTVTITGVSLSSASAVTFDGVATTKITSNSATQIVATVPVGALTGPISVTTPQGKATSVTSYTVLSPFTITSQSTALSVAEGSSASTVLRLTNSTTSTAAVTLSLSGVPSGVAATFSPTSITSSTTSTLSFAVGTTVPAGTYPVTIVGTAGQSTGSTSISLVVSLKQVLTSVAVSPGSASLAAGTTQQFMASAKDQFGNPLLTQPTFTWTSSGGGTIGSTSGLYSALTSGQYTVTATTGSLKGTATISVTGQPGFSLTTSPSSLTIKQGSSAASALSLTASNGFSGEVSVAVSGVPAGVSLVPSASGTALTLTFQAAPTATAGVYTVTFAGTSGSYKSTATVTLTIVSNPILTSISVTAATTSITSGSSVQFVATGKDQFGKSLTTPPAFKWTVSGGGTINASTGLFTATTSGGPFKITATSGTVTGSASVTVAAAKTK